MIKVMCFTEDQFKLLNLDRIKELEFVDDSNPSEVVVVQSSMFPNHSGIWARLDDGNILVMPFAQFATEPTFPKVFTDFKNHKFTIIKRRLK